MRPRTAWLTSLAAVCLVLPVAAARAQAVHVSEALKPFVDEGKLAGAVTLVASPEKVLSLEAVGYSDVAAKTPLKTDAVFWIASMSKPITATALMILVDEGKVKLDDPVVNYLPEFRDLWVEADKGNDHLFLKRPKRPPTVRDLLRHTSGMPFRSAMEEPTLDALTLEVGARSYALTPLLYEPGEKHVYSNAGINTAGRIIEVVTHMPYEEFLQKRLFDPLNMKDTTFWPSGGQLDRIAKSYAPGKDNDGLVEIKVGQLKYPLDDRRRQPMPAGGLFSTAADVGTFCRMILNGGTLDGRRYLSENAVREMTSTQTGDILNKGHGEGGYGLGWSTSRKSQGESGPVIPGSCGHGGAFATNMSIDPEKKLITVYMVQHAGFPGIDGGKIHGAFVKAATETYGDPARR